MDEMKIESKPMAKFVSRFVKRAIRKKYGYNIDIWLNHFRTTILDEKTHVHLDVDLELSKEELNKLLESIVL